MIILARVLYSFLLLVWTWLLLKPEPVPESILAEGATFFDPEMLFFVLAKLTHLSVYAGFASLVGWIARTPSRRRTLWLLLVGHGIASEIGQMIGAAHFDTKRHGCIRDMLIDAAGILSGAMIVRVYPRLFLKSIP